MSAFGPRCLRAACRTIFVQAADDHLLPPLIRDASASEPPLRRIEVQGSDFTVDFRIAYEEPARGVSGRRERPPLRFDIAATVGPDDRPVHLSEAERFELIRAFLLGVREPVVVDAPGDGGDWRIAFKIAPRFLLWSADSVRLDPGLSSDEICERLARRLLDDTQTLFGSRAAGLAVWEARLREELFAEPRSPAHVVWPIEEPAVLRSAPALSALPVVAFAPRAARPVPGRRRAMAAAIALVGLAALAGAIASRHRTSQTILVPGALKLSEATGPAAAPQSVRKAAAAQPASPVQVASLAGGAAEPPVPVDARFAVLAPAVAHAALTLASPSADAAPQAIPAAPKIANNERARGARSASAPAAAPAREKAAPDRRPRKPPVLARVDRALKKFVKSIRVQFPRVKLTALNSPHAAGPRRP